MASDAGSNWGCWWAPEFHLPGAELGSGVVPALLAVG